jgi:uncharacterized protein
MTEPLVPFREFVLKIHSRCDLACDHCYVYEHADQSWAARPKVITDQVIERAAYRLAEHAAQHRLSGISVILHGGEPLLAGPTRLRRICEQLRTALDGITTLDLRIHTNGVQLSERYLDIFAEHDVRIGISLDGDRSSNDRHRRFADGRSSHPLVVKAIGILRQERYRHLYAGLLCTIDVANDPVDVYDALVRLGPPRIDFLLPHATWDAPPPRPGGLPAPYADWLLAVYDRWAAQGRPIDVRLFDSVHSTLAGGPSLTESMGLRPAELVVIETDGSLEQADSLKTAYDGAPATGFDLIRHSFDEAARHPGIAARQHGIDDLSRQCRSCPVVESCGGGLYAHRYRTPSHPGETGFGNPSVYCADLEQLVLGIGRRTERAAARATVPTLPGITAAQGETTRTWLAQAHRELDGRGGALWEHAWPVALELDARTDALDTVLAHPYARTWAAHCLRGEVRHAGYLANLTAAATVRAGLETPVRVAVTDGWVHLPTLGRARAADLGDGPVEVVAAEGGLVLRAVGRETRVHHDSTTPDGRWEPVRRLRPGLVLDDTDPYRDCHHRPAAPRLDDARAKDLQRLLEDALALLRDAAPARAAELDSSLTVLTPLLPGAPVRPAGRRGFGALGVVPRQEPLPFALSLVAGFQYARLDALLDMRDLYDEAFEADGRTYRVPWHEAPVGFEELLGGAWAKAATAEVWRGRGRTASGAERDLAVRRAGRDLAWSEEAFDTAVSSGSLTRLGERLVVDVRAGTSVAEG